MAAEGAAGVTAIDTSLAPVTVSVAMPFTAPLVADITAVPAATDVARPALETVAVAGVAEAHVTDAERFCLLPSS